MSAVRRMWEPEELSSGDLADEREVMATKFPDTRLPFLDDLVVKLDGLRSAVEGVVEGVVTSLLPFLPSTRRRAVDDDDALGADSWTSYEIANPDSVEISLVEPDGDA